MGRYLFLSIAFFVEVVFSQTIIQPGCQQQIPINSLIQQGPQQVSPNLNIIGGYSTELCQNLANQVQTLVLNKLTRKAIQKPIFNQIAGPLLKEIALRVQGCQCPVCGNIPVQALANPIGNYPVQSALNSLATIPVNYGNQIQFGNLPVRTVLDGYLPYQLMNQIQSYSPCNQMQRLPVQNVGRQVNQGSILSPVQQRYSDALSIVNALGSNSNCGCGQSNVLGLY